MTPALPRALVLALLLGLARAGWSAEWIEVRSPNFRVIANTGETRARGVAGELERIRLVFRSALVNMSQDPGLPIVAFAVRNDESLRELLPEYWEREGRKPAGVFLRGSDKHYVVLSVNTRSEERYRRIYHEYFHLLLSLNVQRLPVWLNEGLAEFWEQTVIRGSRVNMGTPNASHIELLYREPMMPLHELLSIEQNPHVSDPDRVGIFYAQAWALTHLLMFGEKGEGATSLGKYVRMVEEGSDSRQAFVSLFGGFDGMEKKLERYVRLVRMPGLQMEAPEKIDDDSFAVAVLSEAAAAAARGNFLVSGARPDAALPLLERALALAPANALALESMGFYHYRKQQYKEAKEWFSKATSVDSESFLCHYHLALLLMSEGGDDDQVKESLRHAIALNPKFAPAYADLGRIYASTGVRLESAYGVAAKAAELEPDNAWYWINVGRILLQMQKPTEARAAAERASSVASSERLRGMVERFQQEIENHGRRLAEVAVEDAAEPAAHPLDTGGSGLRARDRRIEGRFIELRCGSRRGSFTFIVVSDGRSYVLQTDKPDTIQLIENGESVTRDMKCGPQDARVAVIYTPSSEDSDTEGHGELRVLEFLP